MKLLIALLILLILGCNPVKKVTKSQDKTQQVVDYYLKHNPIKSDTFLITTPGEVITNVEIDTVTLVDNNTDSFYLDRYHTITKTITKRRVDTLVKTIRDNSFTRELQRSNDLKDDQISQQQIQIQATGKKADNWKYRSFSLLFLILAFIGYKVFKLFRPSIKL